MGTSLTFHGQDADVVLDDRAITIARATEGATTSEDEEPRDVDEGDVPVVIPRSEVTAVELKPPTLLGYGRLVISTRTMGQHTVQFARGEAQKHFANLEVIIRP